ncbi:unnamed protein product [Closterium sp. Naga37s-1]|nr:unnamed protein product [Closterium sp. Naga37s-1]
MLVADVDRDATFQLKLTSKLDQWHAFHEKATRGLPVSAEGAEASSSQPANVHPLEVDESADATCPSDRAASGYETEERAAESEARAAEVVARAAEGDARSSAGVAGAGAAALETREAKAAEFVKAAVTPKQLDAAADARGAALEAALQMQREEVEAKAAVIQELQVRLHAAETREAGLEASLKLQREELEAKAAEALEARAAEAAALQQQLDEAISHEAAFDASLKLQREELEAKAAEVQGLQELLQAAATSEAAFDASLKLQREELEAKAAEALAAQAGMEERRRVRAAEAAAARLAEVEARLGEVERERERLARNLGRLQQHLLDRDADETLRIEREAERIRQLECQLADKAKALGQSECERVVLERQLADKASQLGQSEQRRVRLEQQLEEMSREVREARMQLAQRQARTEPAGQARQTDIRDGDFLEVKGAGGELRVKEVEEQEQQGMSQTEVLPAMAPGLATDLGTGLAAGGLPGVLPDVLRQVLEAAHRPIVTGHPMCMHARMLVSGQRMEDGDASHAADVASHHASHADVASHHASHADVASDYASGAGTGTGAAASIEDARAADGSESAAASCVDAWAADASHAAATPAYEQARKSSAQVLAREAMCVAAQSSEEAEGAIGAGDCLCAEGSVFEQLSPSPSPSPSPSDSPSPSPVTLRHGQPFQVLLPAQAEPIQESVTQQASTQKDPSQEPVVFQPHQPHEHASTTSLSHKAACSLEMHQTRQHRVHPSMSTPLLSLETRHSRGEQQRETAGRPGPGGAEAGRPGPGGAEAGRQREMAALVEENGRLEAERNRAEEERARAEERSARAGEEMHVLRGNLQEAEALCWQRQAQLEEALSEVAAGRRERGALEEELLRLQCALDQCMLRLNSDSAYMVDRRIVVKLLVAYFQRNRSREVLDIMCRILECSKDERQQLEAAASHPALTRSASFKSKGSARQGSSKGSKGGVFGLPGRIAGGFMGSNRSSSESLGGAGKDSQKQEEAEKKPEAKKSGSLTDLWTELAAQVSILPTAAHVPTAACETHPIALLSPKVSSLPATIPIISS